MFARPWLCAGAVVASMGWFGIEQAAAQDMEAAHIRVRVPAAAHVWFSGQKTAQEGTVRDFVTPKLDPQSDYSYIVRARWTDNGNVVDQSRKVPIFAGDYITVDFRQPPPQRVVRERVIERTEPAPVAQEPPSIFIESPNNNKPAQSATLRVRVPDANAEVWLSGHKTLSKGVMREFTTKALEPDKSYSAQVRAKWSDQGVQVEQQREVNLTPGDRVTIDFTRPEPKQNGAPRPNP